MQYVILDIKLHGNILLENLGEEGMVRGCGLVLCAARQNRVRAATYGTTGRHSHWGISLSRWLFH
jgi:hypothetical protein